MKISFILLASLAATLFLTGRGWSLQLVQLPILRDDQRARHRELNSRLMILPVAVESITALWLAWIRPDPTLLAALGLWLVAAFATLRYSLVHRDPAKDY